ncbi:AAA family ATPase, partial [Candidatus Uhrbacteria bacterium]|nr:AAA family ATPase [Candidatus Uhrbacteria bacterium]
RLTPLINNLKIELGVLEQKIQLLANEQDALKAEKNATSQKIKEEAGPSQDLKAKWAEAEKVVTEKMAAMDEKLETALATIQNFNMAEQQKKDKLFSLERQYQQLQGDLNLLQQQVNEGRITQARIETKKEDLEREISRELGSLDGLELNGLAASDFDPLFINIAKLKSQLELIGGIDPETIKEHSVTKERYDFLSKETTDLAKAMDSLEKIILELDADIKEQFTAQFNKISGEFSKFFKILFGGGQAKLSKVEPEPNTQKDEETLAAQESAAEGEVPEEPAQEAKISRASKFWSGTYQGIEIFSCPPGKKLSSISMLSGGERALTSLALIAAIVYVNPAPFVVFDEVDAALDEANSHRMTKIIQELAHKTQFLIITHNRSIMHSSDVIYGVTMQLDGVSKLLSVKLEEAVAKATRL